MKCLARKLSYKCLHKLFYEGTENYYNTLVNHQSTMLLGVITNLKFSKPYKKLFKTLDIFQVNLNPYHNEHMFQPLRCPNGRFIMVGSMVTTEGEILDFSTPKSS